MALTFGSLYILVIDRLQGAIVLNTGPHGNSQYYV